MARAYCHDWACPARASCALHFGRSKAYWAMTTKDADGVNAKRPPEAEACDLYVRDKIQPWMVEAFGPFGEQADGSWRMPLYVDVASHGVRREAVDV